MSTVGTELAAIDFGTLLGAPLKAIVSAQTEAAMHSVDFIKKVGFNPDGTPATVNFKFNRFEGTETVENILSVPLLTIMPIPVLRIQTGRVEFNAKINSMTYKESTADASADGTVDGQNTNIQTKASTATKKNDSFGNKVETAYSMNIVLEVVQDEMPSGLERILNLLEQQITSVAE